MASTYFVATASSTPPGNNGNPGTIGAPWLTPRFAASVAVAGDTVYFRGGTFTGATAAIDSQGHTVHSGTSYSNAVTFSSYPTETAVFQPSYNVSCVRLTTAVQYIVFQNLVFDMVNSTNPSVAEGSIMGDCSYIRYIGCELKNAPDFGYHAGDTASNIEITGGSVHDCGWPGSPAGDGHGLYMTSSSCTYDGIEVYDNQGYGFHIYNNSGSHANPSNVTVKNCFIHDNGIHVSSEYGIVMSWGSDNVAFNNVIYRNPGGIQIYTGQTNGQAYNNTIYDNTPDVGIAFQYYANAPTAKNNICYLNTTDIHDFGGGTGTPVVSFNLTTNPSFTNAASDDFTLQVGSAAINAGTTIALVTTDITGLSRPQGSAYCIGAYEFVPSGAGWTRIAGATASGTLVGATTSPIDTTGADLIVINIGWNDSTQVSAPLSDSASNTWTNLTKKSNASNIATRLSYCVNPTTSATHTFTTAIGVGFYPSIEVEAWQGAANSPFGAESAGGAGTSIATIQPGTLTPGYDDTLIVTGLVFSDNAAGAISINQSFSSHSVAFDGSANQGSAIGTLTQMTAAAVNPTWNATNSQAAGMSAVMAYFKTEDTPVSSTGGANYYYAMAHR